MKSTYTYIAKPNTFFIEGTKCKLVDTWNNTLGYGEFLGMAYNKSGEKYHARKLCSFEDFEILKLEEAEGN